MPSASRPSAVGPSYADAAMSSSMAMLMRIHPLAGVVSGEAPGRIGAGGPGSYDAVPPELSDLPGAQAEQPGQDVLVVLAFRRLQLGDLRAPVGQHLGAVPAGDAGRQVRDAQPAQRPLHLITSV